MAKQVCHHLFWLDWEEKFRGLVFILPGLFPRARATHEAVNTYSGCASALCIGRGIAST